jgi:tetratricopeptide (TPR) repeat protein
MVKTPTKNIEAYTLYLKGLHYWNKVTPADALQAISCFEQAIGLEPEYAQAYALAAYAYGFLGSTGQISPLKAFAMVHRYADKALQLDGALAEGYIAKASAYLYYDWKWQQGYNALQKALQLNPGATSAYQLLGYYYILMGQKQQAIDIMEKAVQLDPLSPFINRHLGNAYIFAGRYEDAIRQADRLLEMHPQMRIGLELKGWSLAMKGDWAAALTIFEEVHRLTNHPLKGLMGLGCAYAKLNQQDKAMECIRKIEQRQQEDPDSVLDNDLVGIWFTLGNLDKVFYHINQCVEKRTAPVGFFLQYPIFKELALDPRYHELKTKFGN